MDYLNVRKMKAEKQGYFTLVRNITDICHLLLFFIYFNFEDCKGLTISDTLLSISLPGEGALCLLSMFSMANFDMSNVLLFWSPVV